MKKKKKTGYVCPGKVKNEQNGCPIYAIFHTYETTQHFKIDQIIILNYTSINTDADL